MKNIPARMRYVAAAAAGSPDVLRLDETETPQPKPDEVLVRVHAAGVNRPDVAQRLGLYPPPPGASPILGLEVAGEVVALGVDVAAHGGGEIGGGARLGGAAARGEPMNIRVGDRVCALANGGGYAESCAVPATQCLPWPAGYDAIRAAALPETYFTVWANVFELGRLAPGESLLVHGGTSGIGVTAIQLAREFGARVFATAGSDEKCATCVALGAEAAINYRKADFGERIAELTEKRGVDVVLDMIGAPYFERNLKSLAIGGRLVEIATMQGAVAEKLDLFFVMRRRLTISGSTLRPRTSAEKGAIARALHEKVWPALNAGRAGPVIHAAYPLAEAAAAHRVMESSAHTGKLMLRVAEQAPTT
jgi:NADPH2:quinone reductase